MGELTASVALKMGYFLAHYEEEDYDLAEVITHLGNALLSDTRVRSVEVPDHDPEWDASPLWYAPLGVDEAETMYADGGRYRGVRTASPFELIVEVPRKNQGGAEYEFIPETYHVRWDGAVAVIAWSQPEEEWTHTKAGEVVRDVLWDAAHEAGLHLLTQHCDRRCVYPFGHRSLIIRGGADEQQLLFTAGDRPMEVKARSEVAPFPDLVADEVFWHLSSVLWSFAEMKNHARRVLDLVDAIRSDATHLLSLAHLRSRIRSAGWWRSLWAIRKLWKASRQSFLFLSRAWWGLATIEAVRMRWLEERNVFESTADEPGVELLFEADLGDVRLIERQDLSLIQVALDQAATRLDTRAVVSATAAAGVAGALVGGGVTAAVS